MVLKYIYHTNLRKIHYHIFYKERENLFFLKEYKNYIEKKKVV